MRSRHHQLSLWVVACLLGGCAALPPSSADLVVLGPSPPEALMQIALEVLREMHFPIAKYDPNEGVIRTAALPGAQWFEWWRADTVTVAAALESNLQTVRRTVEMRLAPPQAPTRLECRVKVERLSLPTRPVASSAQAYELLTEATGTIQQLRLSDAQQAEAAWIVLGDDVDLARRICRRIEQRRTRPLRPTSPIAASKHREDQPL